MIKDSFDKAQTLVYNISSMASLFCNASESQHNGTIKWIRRFGNQTYYLSEDNIHIQYTDNEKQLNIHNLTPFDAEYYACGILNNSLYTSLSDFFLIIRGILLKYINFIKISILIQLN